MSLSHIYIFISAILPLISVAVDPEEIRKSLVFIQPQIKEDNEAPRHVIADYICDQSSPLQGAIKKEVSINATFNSIAANITEDLDNAFDALQISFACFERLNKVFPISYSTIQNMKINMTQLLAAMNTHLNATTYRNFWQALNVNVFSLSFFRLNAPNDTKLLDILMDGTYNENTMAEAMTNIPEKQFLGRIGLFNGLINQTFVWRFIQTYNTNNLKGLMNTCGIKTDDLFNALSYLKPEVYNKFGPVVELKSYLDSDETVGIMNGPRKIITHKNAKVFAQQNTFKKYTQLAVKTNNNTRYTITKLEDFDYYTSLTTNTDLPFMYPLGAIIPTISLTCVYFTSSQGSPLEGSTTSATFSDPYAWVQYTKPSINILDGTPLLCVNATSNPLIYALSMSDYIYPQNKSVKFDFVQPLEYQTAVAGYVNYMSATSGTTNVGNAASGQVMNTTAGDITNNSTKNVAPGTTSVSSTQVNKNAGSNLDQASDAAFKQSLTNKDVVSMSDNVGSAAKPATSTGTGAVQTAGDTSKPVSSNSLVMNTGNNFNGVVAGPTSTFGNTTGSLGTQVTNQTVVSQMDQQAGGSVSGVGGTATNSGLAQGGSLAGQAANNQAVETLGGQSGAVKNTGSFADTGNVQTGVGQLQDTNVPNASVPVMG